MAAPGAEMEPGARFFFGLAAIRSQPQFSLVDSPNQSPEDLRNVSEQLKAIGDRIAAIGQILQPYKWLWRVALIVIAIASICFVTIPAWLDAKAKKAVLDEKFLAELAGKIRPTCVFNEKGTILADFGTGDYIEGITITRPQTWGMTITIDCKRHLQYPPIIECTTFSFYAVESVRTNRHSWRIRLEASTPRAMGGPPEAQQFKLEILH